MGDELGWRYGELWNQLPEGSRTVRRQAPDTRWSDEAWLLWAMEKTLRVLAWQPTKDGQKGHRPPKPLDTPGQLARAMQRRDNALAARGEIDRKLGMTGR